MRQIKFKAKRLDGKGWVEGDLMKEPYSTMIIESTNEVYNWTAVDPSTICQFTGLKDCKGNEIWESDIIKDTYLGKERTIEWNSHLCSFTALDEINSSDKPLGALVGSLGWYVIGNKFDKEK